MPLFSKKNTNIGGGFSKKAQEVSTQDIRESRTLREKKKRLVDTRVAPPPATDQQKVDYFMKVGIDHKGDLQSLFYEKGSRTTVEIVIDVVALAAACAGAPMPETPLFLEVGAKIKITKTINNLVIAYVGPKWIRPQSRDLVVEKNIAFLAMTGYRFEAALSLWREAGVKTPDLPGIPKPTGGDVSSEKANTINSGTYAELCAFECGAKASITASMGLTGQRMYVSDPVPTFLTRHVGSGSQSTTQELKTVFLSVLEHGDKKHLLKDETLAVFDRYPKAAKHKPARSWWQKNISGGNISTDAFVKNLKDVIAEDPTDAVMVSDCEHAIKKLQDYKAQEVLANYNFVSLWSMKPEASVGCSATATASVKVGVGVAGGGVEATAVVKGPSLGVSYKYSSYRFQVAFEAVRNATPTSPTGTRARSNANARAPQLKPGVDRTPVPPYIITTQDTKIQYGQVDITICGASVKFEAGVQQGIFDDESQVEIGDSVENDKGWARGGASGKVKYGLQEVGVSGEASGTLGKVLNYLCYDSAVGIWTPPASSGIKEGEIAQVDLGVGSGWSYGQSADAEILYSYVKSYKDTGELDGYLASLGYSVGVSQTQFKEFLDGCGDLIEMLGGPDADPNATPSAMLIEATFARSGRATVDVKWHKGRWILGPFGLNTSLRTILIPQEHKLDHLQAIRLRYRMNDTTMESRSRFKLGVKYIVKIGVEYETIENCGSEGIVNLYTHWFGSFSAYNTLPNQTVAYDTAVPQVALLHQ